MDGRNERGQGRIGLLVMLAVVGAAIFVAMRVIPVRIAAYEFRDYVTQECRSAAVRSDNGEVAKRILEKAAELELPLDKKNLRIQRTQSEMIISASFVKPIDLKVGTYRYEFSVKERAPLF